MPRNTEAFSGPLYSYDDWYEQWSMILGKPPEDEDIAVTSKDSGRRRINVEALLQAMDILEIEVFPIYAKTPFDKFQAAATASASKTGS